jgi:hypothetical protein
MADLGVILFGEKYKRATITESTLELSTGLEFAEWEGIGARLFGAHGRFQWFIGDWWVYGERYGGRRDSVPDHFGVNYRTCENYAVVARAFVGSRRRVNLSFSHHAEVAALSPPAG